MNTRRVCVSCRIKLLARAYSLRTGYPLRTSHHSQQTRCTSQGTSYYSQQALRPHSSLASLEPSLRKNVIPQSRADGGRRTGKKVTGFLQKRRLASNEAGKYEGGQEGGPVIKRGSRVISAQPTVESGVSEKTLGEQGKGSISNEQSGEEGRGLVSDEAQAGQENSSILDEIEGQEEAGSTQTEETPYDPEGIAFAARQHFGDRLPRGLLNDEEYRIYERNYGPPSGWDDLSVGVEGEDDGVTLRAAKDVLLKELADGTLEEVIQEDDYMDEEDGVDEESEEAFPFDEGAIERDGPWADMQTALDAVPYERSTSDLLASEPDAPLLRFGERIDEMDGEDLRAHPFTIQNRFATDPTTISMPKDTMTSNVLKSLADVNNKHLSEAAHKLLGGPGLPYATGTPAVSRTMPQKPIPLNATQSKMTNMEANVYCATIMPGIYAAITSTLVEVRKKLGSAWLQDLLNKPGGPKILDVGGAGAGAMAWKEILRAEWARMHGDLPATPVPEGKAAVVAGTSQLVEKGSRMLENTSFLPRLPDYVHAVFHSGSQRKEYDVIIAPHTLWSMEGGQDARNLHLDKLWSLLSPKGGILLIIEKGVPRGFEALADARQYLLDRYLEPNAAEIESTRNKPKTMRPIDKAQDVGGAIVAPCTNHEKCPMYPVPGLSQQRKDYCHFSQRYLRPSYYQHILGAKGRNHEDVRFSYVAVQKGVKAEAMKPKPSARDAMHGQAFQDRKMGDYATERAFEGFSLDDPDIARPLHNIDRPANTSSAAVLPPHVAPNPLSLPRTISPPLKRQGHVIFDVCTPSGTLQRWTVARSFGKQAYRDARKLQWGDLWALGAATRVPKNVRLGRQSKAQLQAEALAEEEADLEDDEDFEEGPKSLPNTMRGGRARVREKQKLRNKRSKGRTGAPVRG